MRRGIATAAVICIGLAACAKSEHAPGGPYYFESFASYKVPFRPVGEISASDAKSQEPNGNAFYAAWFNEHGQIIRVEKRYRGAVEMRVEYTYRDGKLVEGRGIDPDGKAFVQSFEKREP
jgi:hypothetical protein